MNIDIIAVGKINESYFKEAIEEYTKRLARFVKLTIIGIPDEKIPDGASQKVEQQIKDREGEKILSKLKPGFTIAMCVEGTELSSEELANKIEVVTNQASRITFIIGGSLGLSDKVKATANFKLSFGKPTYPHRLMRVILLEQIYRAYKINNHETYHK